MAVLQRFKEPQSGNWARLSTA